MRKAVHTVSEKQFSYVLYHKQTYFYQACSTSISICHFTKFLRYIFGVCLYLYTGEEQSFVDLFDECGDFCIKSVSGVFCCLSPHPSVFIHIRFNLVSIYIKILQVDMVFINNCLIDVIEKISIKPIYSLPL